MDDSVQCPWNLSTCWKISMDNVHSTLDIVHGCPHIPWIPWTLSTHSMDSMDNVHGFRGKYPGHCGKYPGYCGHCPCIPWTLSTHSMDSMDIVHTSHGFRGKYPWIPWKMSRMSMESMDFLQTGHLSDRIKYFVSQNEILLVLTDRPALLVKITLVLLGVMQQSSVTTAPLIEGWGL